MHLVESRNKAFGLLLLVVFLSGCKDEIVCEETYEAVDGIDKASWMTTLYQDQDALLRDILIPGTHDSATYGITPTSDVSIKSGNWLYNLAKPLVAGWSKTQACDVGVQLAGGNRYFDLRLEWHKGEIWIVHGMYSDTLANVLDDVRAFSEENPKEIVILDFQKVTAPDYFDETDSLLQDKLGGLMISNRYLPTDSIHTLWGSGEGNIIAVMNDVEMADYADQYWYRDETLESDWADSGDADVVYEHVTDALVYRADDTFSVAQAVVTPNEQYIVQGAFNGVNNLVRFSRDITENIVDWLEGWVEDDVPVNIIMTDFYDRHDVVATAIRHNRNRLSPTGW